MDMGRHTVCVRVTEEFLAYSKSRRAQAYNAGKAPKLYLQATHEKTLDYIPLEILKVFAIDADEANAVMNKLKLQRNKLDELVRTEVRDDEDSFQ
ncbi:hypothetical protein ACHAXH_007035 [Discostella pseudostelligera]